jgi:hypothetical protein
LTSPEQTNAGLNFFRHDNSSGAKAVQR